ncbi:amidohydrolase family protein [Nocardia brevicatena]|uniref:amidohydrolase family protein n=1 Tax=Nocardia brevicatena TaxID=37327 RepID=UPI000319653B|nr:amidohydrolase family protein [Nocardia brevicatena]
MTGLLFRHVELPAGPCDVAVHGDRVTAIGPGLDAGGAEVIDGRGGALLPGLHDHHLHLHATAADAASIRCGPPQVNTPDELARALAAAPGDGWIRGTGYVETVAGLLDVTALDRLHTRRPVRIQHRSGALWILNSTATALARLDSADHRGIERDETGQPTGRVWRADAWLRERLSDTGGPPALDTVGADLARFGITGVTDATPDLPLGSSTALLDAHVGGALPQRLHLLGVPLGAGLDGAPTTVTIGPYKIVLADSETLDFQALTDTVRRSHATERPVAVHCVSREALLLLLAALDEVGAAGDRIEHGALIPAETIDRLRRHRICVVTQPGFLAHRGDDYLRRVDPRDLPDLYRCRSLLDGGVPLALSSDAPYGPLDPWAAIDAATNRRAPTGDIVGSPERITSRAALERYLSPLERPEAPPRTVGVGAPADLVLLDRPLGEVLSAPTAEAVRLTVFRGEIRYHR